MPSMGVLLSTLQQISAIVAAEGSRLSLAYREELIDYRRNGEVLIY